jgi:hypothetical protein
MIEELKYGIKLANFSAIITLMYICCYIVLLALQMGFETFIDGYYN